MNDPQPALHCQRTLRHTKTAGRPKHGRSASSTRSRSFTDTHPSQRGQQGRDARVSIVTRSRSPVSVTSRTLTSPRPTSSSHMAIGSDDNRDSRISKALNTSRFVESLFLSENRSTPSDPAHPRSPGLSSAERAREARRTRTESFRQPASRIRTIRGHAACVHRSAAGHDRVGSRVGEGCGRRQPALASRV